METHAVMWFCVFAIDSGGFLEERLRMQELSEEGAGIWWEDESSWIGNLRLPLFPQVYPTFLPWPGNQCLFWLEKLFGWVEKPKVLFIKNSDFPPFFYYFFILFYKY